MLDDMRTTINLPDDLMLRVKRAALDSGTTLTQFVTDALREALAKRAKENPTRKSKLITYRRGGVFPGVDLDNTADLLDIMDGLIDPSRR
jgi:hypothetical protein